MLASILYKFLFVCSIPLGKFLGTSLMQTTSLPIFLNCNPPFREEEGRDLVGKRTMDFKVSYLDAGLTNTYFSDSDQLLSNSSTQYSSSSSSVQPTSNSTKSPTPQRVNRRYKTQLRDFLSTCRTKRKINSHHQSPIAHPTPTAPTVDYIATAGADPAATAVAVAYSNLNTMYPTTYPTSAPAADNGLSGYMAPSGNFHQTLYDNRLPYLTTTDNLFHQYRPLGNYYTDYHPATSAPYVSNGFLDIPARASPSSLPTYDPSGHHHLPQENKLNDCDKLYSCGQSLMEPKYAAPVDNNRYVAAKCIDVPNAYMPSVVPPTSCDVQTNRGMGGRMKPVEQSAGEQSPVTVNGLDVKTEVLQHYAPISAEPPRQTVLMWALNHTPQSSVSSGRSPTENHSNASTPPIMINGSSSQYVTSRDVKKQSYMSSDPLKSLAEMNTMPATKWKPETPPSPKTYYHHQYSGDGGAAEVWPPPPHQFYPYHHHHQ